MEPLERDASETHGPSPAVSSSAETERSAGRMRGRRHAGSVGRMKWLECPDPRFLIA